ncbi:MAG: sigma-70 family RNA polymerase sigma factor [Candidatus Paceibacterota bacterium]|jgi:RNA polymerase sigma-70 factor (ECF subfamily)
MQDLSDKELIEKYLKGDEKALEFLISRYLKTVYGFVYRFAGNEQDAEDITQESFVKAWGSIKKFDRKKSFKSWIFKIARNTAIDLLRKKKTVPFSKFDGEDGKNAIIETLADTGPLAQEIFERKSIAQEITVALSELPLKYKAVFSLRHDSDLSFQEIAESLDEPVNTVKSRYRRALIALKNVLRDKR